MVTIKTIARRAGVIIVFTIVFVVWFYAQDTSVEILEPGRAYWVKVSEDGVIMLKNA